VPIKSLRYSFIISALFLLGTAFPAPLSAQPRQTPQQAVEAFLTTIKSMEFPIKDTAQHNQQVQAANAYLDLEAMGKRALEKHLSETTIEEQRKFFDLLWQLIENMAYPKSRKFMGDYQITYPQVRPVENGFEVQSLIQQQAEGLEAKVVYHVYEKDSQWKIDDVILDDVSIAEDFKYQFDKIIAQSQFSGLLDKMQERLTRAEKENQETSVA
jgi:phospholipid transport system substrate-binding protein